VNQLNLSARIAETRPLRYTPAGLPALDLQLEHESEVQEAGGTRQVKVVLKAVAFGAHAETLARQPIGSDWRFAGFLANARNGKLPVLHIQQFQQDN
jgi:primosomal replication protein N